MRKVIFICLLCLTGFFADATHIVGGELYYTYVGNNQYQIRLTVYRDCYNGVPAFDDPAAIGIWDVNNVYLNTLLLSPNDSLTIPPIINSPCYIPPTNVCYRQCNYYGTISLPPRAGGYQLAYQRCCRNQTIVNIVNPLDVGATFYASIPGVLNNTNSNPVFTQLPPPFVCAGLPFTFDHSAIDAEGDSLLYELCTPFNGASLTHPQLNAGGNFVPTYPPPFDPVVFQPPYNLGNLLGGTPLTINPQTGLLTATPTSIGQFVIGVCVNEYRNNVLISKTRRDYQLNIVPCPSIVVAAVQTPALICGSLNVNFTNTSFGASSYSWNFGDPSTIADTSQATNPSYTYPDTGTYIINLTAYSTFNPICQDVTTDTVRLLPEFIADFNYNTSPCSNIVSFNDTSNSASGVTSQWAWNFGDSSPVDSTADPVHTYPGPGTYTVTLQATSALGCKETVTMQVVVPSLVSVNGTQVPVTCTGLCTGSATANVSGGTAPYTFEWSNSQSTGTILNLCPGTYTVTVTDSLGCISTDSVTVTSPAPLSEAVSATEAYCDGLCIGTATASATGGTPPFTITWNDPQQQTGSTASSLCPGWYVALTTDAAGCTTSDSAEVIYSSFIPAVDATISDDTIFAGQQVQLTAAAQGSFSYSWQPATGLSSPAIANPIATPVTSTTYYVTITDEYGCSNTDTVSVIVREVTCEEPEIFIPNAFTPNGDYSNDKVYVRGSTIKQLDFKIFDRWGEKVFETSDPAKGWDGYYKGKLANPAVYVYYVEAVCYGDEKFFKKGNITLIR